MILGSHQWVSLSVVCHGCWGFNRRRLHRRHSTQAAVDKLPAAGDNTLPAVAHKPVVAHKQAPGPHRPGEDNRPVAVRLKRRSRCREWCWRFRRIRSRRYHRHRRRRPASRPDRRPASHPDRRPASHLDHRPASRLDHASRGRLASRLHDASVPVHWLCLHLQKEPLPAPPC